MKTATGELWQTSDARGDLSFWIHSSDPAHQQLVPSSIISAVNTLDELRLELNKAVEFKSKRHQVQVACYPGQGARYVRHLDALPPGPDKPRGRRLTALYYMNPEWTPKDGGALRMHLEGDEIDIEPLGDRLVVFASEYVEHEVLPAYAARFTLTMWYY